MENVIKCSHAISVPFHADISVPDLKIREVAIERRVVVLTVQEKQWGRVLQMLTLVAQALKDFLIVEESLEYLGLRISIEAVSVPFIRIPGIEENPRAILFPGWEQDLPEDLTEAPHLPSHIFPGLGTARVGLLALSGGPVEQRLQAGQGQHARVQRGEIGLLQTESRSLESQAQTELLVGLKDRCEKSGNGNPTSYDLKLHIFNLGSADLWLFLGFDHFDTERGLWCQKEQKC